MSVHTPSRALRRVEKPSILLGQIFGSGADEHGNEVDIVASGRLVRFTVNLKDGRRAQYDLDISAHAAAAIELAKVEA